MTGGINTKVSLYITAEGEFLDLFNVDFRTPGALSSFAGNTLLIDPGASSPITGISDFLAVRLQQTASQYASYSIIATDNFNVTDVVNDNFSGAQMPLVTQGNSFPFSFASGGTALFGCNGSGDFWTFQGSTVFWQAGLPKPLNNFSRVQFNSGGTAGLAGNLNFFYSLVRSDGLYGPALACSFIAAGGTLQTFRRPYNVDLSIGSSGLSFGSWGLSGIQMWAQLNGGLPIGFTPLLGLTTGPAAFNVTMPFFWTATGLSSIGWELTTPQPYDYQGSFLYGLGSTQGSGGGIFLPPGTFNPAICETFANQLFTTGFYTNPSRVVYSNAGTPEIADYANFFDVGADSLPLSAMRSYFTQLMLWKDRQTWALSGTGPDTFVLTQVSSIYGCLSKNACVVWNQNCWFLDETGIFEFNGANVQRVSDKMDHVFRRMNVDAARITACMVHVKDRNEVWCLIPIDGSPGNNTIVVYDYLVNGWAVRYAPTQTTTTLSSLARGLTTGSVYYGGSTGTIGNFGSSLVGTNGFPLDFYVKSRFIEGDLGNSVTKMFRRLYVDAKVPDGETYIISLEFYQDKGASIVYQTTMALSAYQSRIDFGIPAKSLAVAFYYSDTKFFQLNGFTIEYRFQRAT